MSSTTMLPVADSRAMRGYVRTLAHRHPRLLGGAVLLHVLAAVAALAAEPLKKVFTTSPSADLRAWVSETVGR